MSYKYCNHLDILVHYNLHSTIIIYTSDFQDEHNSRAELDRLMDEQPQNQPRRVNPDLLEGRTLQQALVDKLWRDVQ